MASSDSLFIANALSNEPPASSFATFIIPGNTAGAGTNIPLPSQGMALVTGFAFATTTESTDAGTTAVAASEIVINYGTK